jgi:hypothetical protein
LETCSGVALISINHLGTKELKNAINEYINRCPQGRVVILGFSSGAEVVRKALVGPNPLKMRGRLAAAIMYADPAYRDNVLPIDAGTGASNGHGGITTGNKAAYNRLNTQFGSKLRSCTFTHPRSSSTSLTCRFVQTVRPEMRFATKEQALMLVTCMPHPLRSTRLLRLAFSRADCEDAGPNGEGLTWWRAFDRGLSPTAIVI